MCLLFTELDGRQIEHLDYHEIYNPSNASQSSNEEMEEQKQHSARQDEFILKHLFKETGLSHFTVLSLAPGRGWVYSHMRGLVMLVVSPRGLGCKLSRCRLGLHRK